MSDPGGGWVGHLDDLSRAAATGPSLYKEFLRSASLSSGVYVLPARARDPQRPHGQDEIYVVWKGQATLEIEGRPHPVRPGSVAFVAAGRPHRFVDVREELSVLVLFAPPETE